MLIISSYLADLRKVISGGYLRHFLISGLQIFINMLDFGNVLKQSQRTHLCIELKIGILYLYVGILFLKRS